jgi:2-hydroxy-3-oxopropionate reductase
MVKIGVVGLGVMGRPMARNLLAAGFDVTVHNRSPGPQQQLVAEGATGAGGPAELAAACDVVLTVLSDDDAVADVVLSADGLLSAAKPGLVLVDLSTVSPTTAQRVATAAQAKDVAALDAPVSGGEVGAIEGSLSIMVGGEKDAFDRVSPVLEALGSTVAWVGPSGAGQATKAANQIMVAGIIAAVCEAVAVLETQEVAIDAALSVISNGYAANRILSVRGQKLVERDFTPGARVALHDKDLRIALGLARDQGVPVPVTALMGQWFSALRSLGRGDWDHTAVLSLLDDMAKPHGQRAHDTRGT